MCLAQSRRAGCNSLRGGQAPALVKWSWRRSGAVGVMASPGPLLRAAGRGACASSLHTIQIGSSVDMAPGLRELIALSLLAGLGVVALRWPTVICFSSLFLAAPSQWRLSRRYGIYGEDRHKRAASSRNPIYRTRWSRGVLAVPTEACCPRLELATKVGLRNSVHATQGVAAS